MKVHIDFETRGTLDLRSTGVYPYAMHPDTDLWCMAYSIDGRDGVGIWTPGDAPPPWVRDHLAEVEIHAWNAQFERIIWWMILTPRYGWPRPEREQFFCTAASAAAIALPRKLADAARVLGLDEQIEEHKHGLILRMSRPRKVYPDGGIEWWETPDRMEALHDACRQDVRTEVAVSRAIPPLSSQEREIYLLDQRMNDRGVALDLNLIEASKDIVREGVLRSERELESLTDGELVSVTKVGEMTSWLKAAGVPLSNLRKDTVRDLLTDDQITIPWEVRRVLELRAETAKTSTAKLDKMIEFSCPDNRARGMLLYHGASTGRWAGKGPQPQNYPRPEIKNAEKWIPSVMARDYASIEKEHPPLVVVSALLRSMLVAGEGKFFLAADYAQIEARVTAWLAGQQDLVDLFATGGKVYEDMAATIYGQPVDSIGKDSVERQIGKMAVLGCGFGMGAQKFATQVAAQVGIELTEPAARAVINAYRRKNHRIVGLWSELDSAALQAVASPGKKIESAGGKVRWQSTGSVLWCQLPSGRLLAYTRPRIEEGRYGTGVTYEGVNSYTRRWERRSAYGGLWTENVVQAVARDLMADAMLRADEAGYPPVLTIHDEVLVETDHGTLEELVQIMETTPAWAEGLPVKAEGWKGRRYRK